MTEDASVTLGFDSSAAHCAAALLSGDRVLAHRQEQMAKGQAERLFPLLEEMLEASGLGWRDLGRIGVGIGPGNFTGLRISVAAARGLALSLGIPAIGVGTPEAMAEGLPRPLRVVLPAAGGMVAIQDFLPDQPDIGPKLVPAPDARPATPGLSLTGTGIADGLPPAGPIVVAIARIARRRHLAGDTGPRPAPIYLRPADAAPPRQPGPRIIA